MLGDELTTLGERLQGLADPLGLLAALFLHAPVAFQICSARGQVVLVNPAFRELFGSAPPPDYNILEDELAAAQGVLEHIRRAFAGETVHVPPFWYDARELRQVTVTEGRRVAIQCTFFPLVDPQGRVHHVATAFKDVTAEMRLREQEHAATLAEERLRTIVSHAPVALFSTDAEGIYTFIEGQRLAKLGMRQEDLIGRSILEVTGEDPVAASMLRKGLAGEEATWRGTGKLGAFECRLIPDKGPDGRVRGLTGVSYDVSDQTKALEALEASERRFRKLVERGADVLTLQSATGACLYASPSLFHVLGYRADEYVGHHLLDFVHPEDVSKTRATFAPLMEQPGASRTGQYRMKHKDGSWRWMEAVGINLLDDPDVRGIAVNQHDVTERRRAEEALRGNEERLRLALMAGRLVAVEVDYLTGNISCSPNVLEVTGASVEQLGTMEDAFALIHPADRAHVVQSIAQARERGALDDVQYRVIRPDNGETVWIERRMAVARDETGNVIGSRGLFIDITERRRAEEIRARSAELELTNRRIQEASRLKSEFLANMSHELRTPLNAIIGFSELLYDGLVDPTSPRYKEFLGDILTSGRHLLQLINDVLDLSKVEAGKLDFHPERIDLTVVVREVTTILRTLAAEKRIRVDVETDGALGAVSVDPGRLKQVLYNFLSNALKFTPDSGHVVVRTLAGTGDTFRLEVEDTGIGIAPADIGRIFTVFQQLDTGATKRHAGTGLGLALTKRLVEAQGGEVGVRSVLGVGSTFHAILPQQAQEHRPRSNPPSWSNRPGASTILVVEDDPGDQALLIETLSAAGYSVELAHTGSEAMEKCQKQRFDAVTLDLLLPDMSGLDLLPGIRATGPNRNVPVIVVTVADHRVISGFAVHDVLRKPLDSRALLGSLERAGVKPDKPGSILIVDDDPGALRLMEATLVQLGYQAVCRTSGREGLEAAARLAPAAVVLDLLMPEMDGFEFLERLRKIPSHARTPVIVWTSKDLTANERVSLHESVQAVISKNGSGTQALLAEIRAFLASPREGRAPIEPLEKP
jgi:PAS domain S-box-containing protein